jgi:hypothetical protein
MEVPPLCELKPLHRLRGAHGVQDLEGVQRGLLRKVISECLGLLEILLVLSAAYANESSSFPLFFSCHCGVPALPCHTPKTILKFLLISLFSSPSATQSFVISPVTVLTRITRLCC